MNTMLSRLMQRRERVSVLVSVCLKLNHPLFSTQRHQHGVSLLVTHPAREIAVHIMWSRPVGQRNPSIRGVSRTKHTHNCRCSYFDPFGDPRVQLGIHLYALVFFRDVAAACKHIGRVEVAHTSCKQEFQRNPGSHSWCFSLFYVYIGGVISVANFGVIKEAWSWMFF